MKPITIVGGGLAGLSLGIGLRQQSIPVTVWEAGHYPRHRVCGEFVSGLGQQALERLGLRDRLLSAGGLAARSAAFFSGKGASCARSLPAPALCLSRYTMDAALAEHFQELGGELRLNARWRESHFGEGVVRANGRRARPVENGWRWFGLKIHARNVALSADLEMHLLPNGYVGLCRLDAGEVNVCGLFRQPAAAPRQGLRWNDLLQGSPATSLGVRLARAEFDENSSCAVAGLSLQPQQACAQPECCVGDALTMIPPVTGNGMSMAFESAELALGPLIEYGRGEISWPQAQRFVAQSCDERFSRRLTWAKWVQWIMFAPGIQGRLGALALKSDWLWNTMFARTR